MVSLSYVVFGFTPLILCGWNGIYILVKVSSSLAKTQAFNTSAASSVYWLTASGLVNATGSGATLPLHRSLPSKFYIPDWHCVCASILVVMDSRFCYGQQILQVIESISLKYRLGGYGYPLTPNPIRNCLPWHTGFTGALPTQF